MQLINLEGNAIYIVIGIVIVWIAFCEWFVRYFERSCEESV